MRVRAVLCAPVVSALCAAAASADDAQAGRGVLTRAPELVHFVEAEYPPEEEGAGRSGEVVLLLSLDATGRVTDASVARSAGAAFDAAALRAARGLVFTPAEIDGTAAAVTLEFRYRFELARPPDPPPALAQFRGVVRTQDEGAPLPGVFVRVFDAASGDGHAAVDVTAITDDAGAFFIPAIPPGEHDVELSGPGVAPVLSREAFVAGHETTARYDVREQPADDGATPSRKTTVRARLRKEVAVARVAGDEARRVPGTQGDALKVVHALPGVARPAVGSGALVVWGAAPADTRVFVDDIEVPALYHLGGVRSIVASDLVEEVELVPGAYGVAAGRGIGGLVRVATRDPPGDTWHAFANVDMMDGGVVATAAPLDRLRLAGGARVSWLHLWLVPLLDAQLSELVPVPRYLDGQAKAVIALRPGEELTVGAFGAGDEVTRSVPAADPAEARQETLRTGFVRGFARYSRQFEDRGSVTFTSWLGAEEDEHVAALGALPTRLKETTRAAGLRGLYTRPLASFVTVSIGLDGLAQASDLERVGNLALPPREGDAHVFAQVPASDVATDTWSAPLLDVAPFASADLRLSSVTFSPGVRLDGYAFGASRSTPKIAAVPGIGTTAFAFVADPRATLAWAATRDVSLRLGAGVYHQPPAAADVSAVFGTPALGLEKATHVAGGGAARLTSALSIEATAFYRYAEDLVVRSVDLTPARARALTQDGVGVSYGATALARLAPSEGEGSGDAARGPFGWIAYTLSRSERQDHASARYRLSDFDQTHVVTVVAGYALAGFDLGVRVRASTGAPRTPVVGAYLDTQADRFRPLFGAPNDERLPPFFQADLRAAYTLSFDGIPEITASLDVLNATWRQNPEEIVYDYDYTDRAYVTGLPLLVIAGVRVSL